MEETAGFDITPVQFAILNALIDDPGEDQITLAGRVAFDAATSGSVISRLEAKGLIRREPALSDRRRKLLWITSEGQQAAQRMKRAVARAQTRVTAALNDAQREQLVALLHSMVAGHTPPVD